MKKQITTHGGTSLWNTLVSSGGEAGKGDSVCKWRREKRGKKSAWIILEDGTLPRKKKDIIKSGTVRMTQTCNCLSPLRTQVPQFKEKAIVIEGLL